MSEIDFSSLTVLVIEDEPSLNELLDLFLQNIGFEKTTKSFNGLDALEQLRVGGVKPDIILCDLKMPEMDGMEFLSIIRSDPGLALKETPVLVLTGNKEDKSINEAIAIGIHGYLVKPVMLEDLHKNISQALTSPMMNPGG